MELSFNLNSWTEYEEPSANRKRLPWAGPGDNLPTTFSPLATTSMYRDTHRGWVEVITGVMFAGKSEEMIRRVRRAVIAQRSVQVFKSHLDDRYGATYRVFTHDGGSVDAEPVDSSIEIVRRLRPDTKVVAIDEIQFLDEGIIHAVTTLADEGRRVICAGTDLDFRGEPFGPMPELLAVAEMVDKLHAICVRCGDLATRNQRLVDDEPAVYDSPTILVGGRETYEPRCRRCHEVPHADRRQTLLL